MNRQVPTYEVLRWSGRRTLYCLVIPVINEGERIRRLLERIKVLGISEQIDVIVVDGGSKDGSLSDALLDTTGVAGLLLKTGPGKLSAQLRCAYAFALDQGYQGIITIDGNNRDEPSVIPEFVKTLGEGFDFAQASRFIPGGQEENTPWKRRLAIRWLHSPLLSLASGFHWTDTTQGFRAYSRRMLEDPRVAPFREIFQNYELLAYLSYRAPKLGYRCIELPTLRRYPKDAKVTTKVSPFWGELELVHTLITACRGGFDPA
jgi:dolichol-phosphate mannosyltransferase